ncbi:MAG TPA: hypothetical protein VNQ76_09055 [Planctomicrobium sp.]|nr:hypothetical protein [Planctomicrobium sp.]
MTPDFADQNENEPILFQERFASGFSWKSLRTRMGRANNCLWVRLTPSTLKITCGIFLFRPITRLCDLEHTIPLDRIVSIQRKRFGRFEITFLVAGDYDEDEERTLTLVSWHANRLAQAFINAGVAIDE